MGYYRKCHQGSLEYWRDVLGRKEVNRSIFEYDVHFYVIIYT